MTDKYRYASTYWRYFEKMWRSDADLKSLVRRNWDMEMAGEQSTLDYYEQVGGEWVLIPIETIEALENEVGDEQRAEREAAFLTAQTQRWRVWTQGPDGIRGLEGTYGTEWDALAAAAGFPSILKAAVEHRGDEQ